MARHNEHNRAEELISAYLDKRVSAEEKDFFERHVASCANCRAQLEATRSMIAALRTMPVVKAPRSFVLPREMAKQPRRSFLSLYPALRLATVVAALAFVVLFAGDVLLNQSGSSGAPQFVPATEPASVVMQAPEAARQAVPTQESAAAETAHEAAMAPTEPAAGAAGAAAKAGETAVMTEAAALSLPTATPEATAVADVANQAQMMLSATPEPSELTTEQRAGSDSEQPAAANVAEAASAPTIDTLRVVEIALLALAIVLGAATLIVRRRQA